MKQFSLPITITIDGFLKVSANTYEEAFVIANSTYCEVNIDELKEDENFTVVNEELEFPSSFLED